jgi:hypothetical protein
VVAISPGPWSASPPLSSSAVLAGLSIWRVQSLAADWRRHGRAAGPIRNRLLLEQALVEAQAHTSPAFSASVMVIAFPGGAGTASLVQQARRCSSRSPVPVVVNEAPLPFSPEPFAA